MLVHEALQEIRTKISCTDFLERSRKGGRNHYQCPFCFSGTGPNGTGALTYYPETNTFYCFSCQKSGDVIDLYEEQNGVDFPTAISLMAKDLGITIDRPTAADDFKPEKAPSSPGKGPADPARENVQADKKEPAADYTNYYVYCSSRLEDPAALAYLQGRGISLETARRCYLGFDPSADPANNPGLIKEDNEYVYYIPHPAPRIIFPCTKSHYVARSIDPNTPPAFKKMNPAGSTPGLFNEAALYAQDVREVFITEGVFDALSILEAGYPAIALNSTSNWELLTNKLQARRTNATLILCLDNDKPGRDATERLQNALERLEIPSTAQDVCGKYKDPNEALTGNRVSFLAALQEAVKAAHPAARPDNTRDYIDNLMTADLDAFRQQELKTGFNNLDAKTRGLYSGLYVLAAGSSLGKTTLALQLADQIAERGTEVIYFSLEQSRLELVTKSISRRTAQKDLDEAATSISIRSGYLSKTVLDAFREYKEAIADRISIVEGNFDTDITFISDYVRRYVKRNGVRPVVFLDYLQILRPVKEIEKKTTKEAIDYNITELKRLSRDLGIVVIAISSINRANYLQPIDFESLKESGAIEYSCDVVWGLQLQCLNEELFSFEGKIKEKRARIKEAKAEKPYRKIELVCLKNRFGPPGYSCYFNYNARYDLYEEGTEAAQDFPLPGRTSKAGRKL